MKKFEEEFDKNVTSVALRQDGESVITLCDYKEAKAFGHDWVSPEDHQAEIAKLNSKIDWLHGLLDERNEEVLQTVKRLNEAQPEIPEVPQFVAEWYEKNKNRLELALFIEIGAALDGEYPHKNEFLNWIDEVENKSIETIFSMKNGYTVKEKRFYLKHIDMSKKYNSNVCVLAHGEGNVIYGHYEFPVGVYPKDSEYIFTQSEIDSMKTGSYEQIEVTE